MPPKAKLPPLKVVDDRPKSVPKIGGIEAECPRCGPTYIIDVYMAGVGLGCGCRWNSMGSINPRLARWEFRE